MKKTLLALSLLLCLSLVACGSSPEDGSTAPEEPKPNTPQVEAEQEQEIITKELIEETIRGLEFPVEQKIIVSTQNSQDIDAYDFFEQNIYKCWEGHELNTQQFTLENIQFDNLDYTISPSEDGNDFIVDCTANLKGSMVSSQEAAYLKTQEKIKFSLVFNKLPQFIEAIFPQTPPLVVPIEQIDFTNLKQYFTNDQYHYYDTNQIEKKLFNESGFDYGRGKLLSTNITKVEVMEVEFDNPEIVTAVVHVMVEAGSQKFQGEICINDNFGNWDVYVCKDLFLLKEDAI